MGTDKTGNGTVATGASGATAGSASEALRELNLPPVEQVGFVVPDLDAALALYEPIFGPFALMDSPLEGCTFRGRSRDCHLRLAFARSGELEIELIQPVSGESPHREFVDAGGNGMHHLRFRINDGIDAKISEAASLGYECIWYKRLSDDIAFAYLSRAGDPLLLELLEMP